MSWVKDVLGFELFNAKDILKSIRKDPERLLLGAADPASTELWNTILGKDYEPMVDQMGGAYDGKVLSWGGDGGVYKRARQDGIDTGPGLDMQRAAHVIAALFAANGLMGMGGGGSPTTPTPDAGGTGGGMFDFQSMNWQDPNTYIKLSKMMPQQQQQQAPPPQPAPPQLGPLQAQQNDLISNMGDMSWNNYLDSFYKFREMANLAYT